MNRLLLLLTSGFAVIAFAICGCKPSNRVQPESVSASTTESTLLLPDAERAFLWQCEHNSNLLSAKGFAAIASGLRDADRQQLNNALAEGFRGVVVSASEHNRLVNEIITVRRDKPDGGNSRAVKSDGFVQWLLGLRDTFAQGPSVGFALLSYAPTQRGSLDGNWHGRARLRIAERTDEEPQEVVVSFDFTTRSPNENSLTTRWLSTCQIQRVDYANARQVLMREVAADRGLAPGLLLDNWTCATELRSINTGGIYLADFNRDGFTDLLVTEPRSSQSLILYYGAAEGRFENVTQRSQLPMVAGADHAVIADLDNDGWEDLVLLGAAVFRNQAGSLFQDATAASNLDDLIAARGLAGISGASVADYDRDGLIDLYITRGDSSDFKAGSWIDGKSGQAANNQLLRNLGGGMFEDVTDTSGASGGKRSTFTSAWLDADNDGWPDLYVIHEFGAGALLVNQRDGTFAERQIAEHSDDFGSMGLASGDMDNDGQIDLYVSNMYSKAGNRVMDNLSSQYYDDTTMAKLRRMVAGSQLHMNRGDRRFEPIANRDDIAAVGWGWGASLVDLDNDGWLDIHATCGFMSQDRAKPDG